MSAGWPGSMCCAVVATRLQAFLYAFDLLELDGTDLRREPLEVRKATLASILRKSRHGVRLNEHLAYDWRADSAPACLCAWVRGHCFQASRIALPVWAITGLAEVQESVSTVGEA